MEKAGFWVWIQMVKNKIIIFQLKSSALQKMNLKLKSKMLKKSFILFYSLPFRCNWVHVEYEGIFMFSVWTMEIDEH